MHAHSCATPTQAPTNGHRLLTRRCTRRCTRTSAYVLRMCIPCSSAYVLRGCVPSRPRAPSAFSSASPPGEQGAGEVSPGRVSPAGPPEPPPTSSDGESTESSEAPAPSALAALAGLDGRAKPAGDGRLRAAGNAPAHDQAVRGMRVHTRARRRGAGTIESIRPDGCGRSGTRLIDRAAPQCALGIGGCGVIGRRALRRLNARRQRATRRSGACCGAGQRASVEVEVAAMADDRVRIRHDAGLVHIPRMTHMR